MASPCTLFEISWEVCNKVGGIHTVLSSKAKIVAAKRGDDYVTVGPWLLSEAAGDLPFEEEPGFEAFADSCRQMGVPVRVGRWKIPGNPRTILVEFSGLYDQKDDILASLWEEYQVDSISGEWDYVEPVIFGRAAAMVIERWWEEYVAPAHRRAVAHFHEWMTVSGLLHLKNRNPGIGTVFTTHATMLGRALSSVGHSPEDGLGDATPDELAETHGVVAKHSIEGVGAREADVFTTVSQITAKEAELLHARAPAPQLPNGIDISVVDELAGAHPREEVRARLHDLAGKFLGEDVGDAIFLCISGRYEYHNKGLDLLLDALEKVQGVEGGRCVVLWVLVPAGHSGVKSDLLERLENGSSDGGPDDASLGLSTHNLFDAEHDAVQEHATRVGLSNERGSRVKVIHVPIYLSESDEFLNLPYEAVLRGMDLSCFPSYYEPWGYTPQESLAVGVPTITSDYAGFGRWADGEGLDAAAGVTVLRRVHVEYGAAVEQLVTELERFLSEPRAGEAFRAVCRRTAARTEWADLIARYEEAYDLAVEAVQGRLERGVPLSRRPRVPLKLEPAKEGDRPHLSRFDVSATLPPSLVGLKRLAWNFYWCWDPAAPELFHDLSPEVWATTGHNPIALLKEVGEQDVSARSADANYVGRVDAALARLDAYLAEPVPEWEAEPGEGPAVSADRPVAYFCAEFGIHESLRVYSGGLGILAGDHLKAASDCNLPLVAVGLFYKMGYLHQRVTPTGEQVALERESDPGQLPLELVCGDDGQPLELCLQLPSRQLYLRAWRVQVGRVTLYLLDANTSSNRPEDREITRHLYGGDADMRLRQEIVLGRGGARLLASLGIRPSCFHINEGHAAFLALERVSRLVRKEGLTFDEAREYVRATTVFTTHTPVPAGHDRFDEDLMRRYFSDVADWVGVPWERFFELGQTDDDSESFNMTYLALRFAGRSNGVSKIHGAVSRKLLHAFWPRVLESEVPVGSITNGVHLATWTAPRVARLLRATGGPVSADAFERARDLKPTPLWKARQEAKRELVAKLGEALRRTVLEQHDSPTVLASMQDGLDEEALWIGFARRFAPYKRAHLLFRDRERLRDLLGDTDRPVRIVVAGKAHPNDGNGKSILKEIAGIARSEDFVGRVFFVEDYDIDLARTLVQGVDVWMNNPTRKLEASGTSGMKVAANGGLNFSVGDGWWPEAHDGMNGWTIEEERVYDDQALQDELDGATIYRLLEEEIVPLYFDRKRGIPLPWLDRVKRALETIPPNFSADRMVRQYASETYLPLAREGRELAPRRHAGARRRAREAARIRRGFDSLVIESVRLAELSDLRVGDPVELAVEVLLGELEADDVRVELLLGRAASDRDLIDPVIVPCAPTGRGESGGTVFEGRHVVGRSGQFAYGIRVRGPERAELGNTLADLARWA